MDEQNTQAMPMDVEDEAILPEGWAEGDDIFGDTWAEDEAGSQESAAPAAVTETPVEDPSEGATPNEDTSAEATGESDPAEAAPAIEQASEETAPTPAPFRFQTTLDHQPVDVEVKPEEIEEIYQKAYITDRVRKRLEQTEPIAARVTQVAKQLGYDSADEWIEAATQSRRDQEAEKLIEDGVHPEVAAYIAAQRVGNLMNTSSAADPAPEAEAPAPSRDFQAEVEELYRTHPETRDNPLPPDVVRDCVKGGKPLVYAYMDYQNKQTALNAASEHEELMKLRAQLAVEQQNSAAAARAPVTGVSGGGATETKPTDPFEIGFDADDQEWSSRTFHH